MRSLPIAECRRGFEAAFENALRYHHDAARLAKIGRFHTAALLEIFAVDELGQASQIARAALRRDKSADTWKRLYDDLRKHVSHFKAILRLVNLLGGGFLLPDEHLDAAVNALASRDAKFRDNVAYVQLVKGQFMAPAVVVTEEQCRDVLARAGDIVDVMSRIRPKVLAMFHEDLQTES